MSECGDDRCERQGAVVSAAAMSVRVRVRVRVKMVVVRCWLLLLLVGLAGSVAVGCGSER